MKQIAYTRTVIGWYNVTDTDTGARYNVAPAVFYAATNVSKGARMGCLAVTAAQYDALLTGEWTRRIQQPVVEVAV